MAVCTFDTSVIIAYSVRELPKNFLLSAVVMAELTASAADNSLRKVFEAMRRGADKYEALIVPTADDWLTRAGSSTGSHEAGKRRLAARPQSWLLARASECSLTR